MSFVKYGPQLPPAVQSQNGRSATSVKKVILGQISILSAKCWTRWKWNLNDNIKLVLVRLSVWFRLASLILPKLEWKGCYFHHSNQPICSCCTEVCCSSLFQLKTTVTPKCSSTCGLSSISSALAIPWFGTWRWTGVSLTKMLVKIPFFEKELSTHRKCVYSLLLH